MNTTQSREHVGESVSSRRLQMGMTASAFAKHAGVDVKTLRSLESGARWPREDNRSKIEAALRWKQGALEALHAGDALADQVLRDPDALSDGANLFRPTDSPVRDLRRIGKILGLEVEHLEAVSDAEARPVLAQITLAYHGSGLWDRAAARRRGASQSDVIDESL